MGAQGTTTVDFGSFPGGAQAFATVTGQASIGGSSLAEAFIPGGTTADHSEQEHSIEDFACSVEQIVAGTGFTIVVHPLAGRCYGLYNVAWVWN